jgi:Zn-dependent protease with chaperone function
MFGYYNAFVIFPKAFHQIIPMGSQAFLYASEGFFEALSPEEQRFLIGHELVHAREHHLFYSQLLFIVIELLSWALAILIAWCFFRRYGKRQYAYLLAIVLVVIFELGIGLMMNGYRRWIEREADAVSLELLQSHDGGLKLIERWLREHKMPLHNAYGGLWADHPSPHERKVCFLECKNKQKGS